MFNTLLYDVSHAKIDDSMRITTDIHSHLIPGIDDGVKTHDEAIEVIKKLQKMGYKKLITTPHIMHHRFPNTKERILKGLQLLKKSLKRANIGISIEAAAEYYLDDHFISLIHQDDLLTFGDNHVLFELSYRQEPTDFESTVDLLIHKGYKPVLAHPERYTYFHDNLEIFEKLHKRGLILQMNINSLNRFYGKKVQESAIALAKKGIITFFGSDTHSVRYAESLKESLASFEYQNALFSNKQKNSTL